MRDPELVSCAQRAAIELERAWASWRTTRARAGDPAGQAADTESVGEPAAESVASYVAHSIDHPWGRPRVVLGLDAEDAHELAALLQQQEHDSEQPAVLPRR